MYSVQLPDQPSANFAYQFLIGQPSAVLGAVTLSIPRNFVRRRLYVSAISAGANGYLNANVLFELGGTVQYTLPFRRSTLVTAGTLFLPGTDGNVAGGTVGNDSIGFGDSTTAPAEVNVHPWHINIAADLIRFRVLEDFGALNYDFLIACHSESLLI